MSPPRSFAKTQSAVIRLPAERYQCAAPPQSLTPPMGFHVAALSPSSEIHDVSRSSGAKTETAPRLARCRAVRRTNSSLVDVATALPDQLRSVGTTTVEVLPDRCTPSTSTLSSAGAWR